MHDEPGTVHLFELITAAQMNRHLFTSTRPAHNVEHLPLHFVDALRGVHLVQASQPPVIRYQRLGLPFIRLQPRPDNFFAIVRPLLQLAAILVAAQIAFRRAHVNIINLPAYLAHAPAGDPPQQQLRINHKVHHQRRLVPILPQQTHQVLRLRHGPGKPVKHKTVRAIRLLDPLLHHLEHQRIGNQFAALHDGLGLYSQRRALGDILAEHVAGRKMRHTIITGQLLRLRTLSRARRPEKNHSAVQLLDGLAVRRRYAGLHLLPPAAQPALPRKPFVIPHDQLCFQLLHRIHGHADDDQQRRAAEIKLHAEPFQEPGREVAIEPAANAPSQVIQVNAGDQPFRQQANYREINGADEGKALQNLADMLAGGAPRPDTRDETAVLAHVVRELGRVEDDADVEEREQDNQYDVHQVIERLAKRDDLAEILDERVFSAKHQRCRGGKRQQRAGKNRRNHTAGIDAQRQVRGLPAHYLAADHALGVLHRDAPLAAFDEDDEGHDGHHEGDQGNQHQRGKWTPGSGFCQFVQVQDGARQPDNNAYKYDKRHAISDSALADLLAQPHDEGRTGGQGQNGHQHETETRMVNQGLAADVLALQRSGDGGGLDDAQQDRQIARVLRNFTAAEFAFFLQLLEIREHHGHQLQDDGRGDIRHDAERENGQTAQVAAAEHIEDAQDRTLPLLEKGFQHTGIDARRRDMRSDAIHREQRQGKQYPVPQIGDAEEVPERFDESVHNLALLHFLTLRPRMCHLPW